MNKKPLIVSVISVAILNIIIFIILGSNKVELKQIIASGILAIIIYEIMNLYYIKKNRS